MNQVENYQEKILHNSSVLSYMSKLGHESVYFCNDKATGLKAIIAIHNTVLGPSLGGVRMWDYNNESEAINDVLRLSRGMTYKASISGLNLGGGKGVIIGNQNNKTKDMMEKFGDFVNQLGGRYITAEDVGISPSDMISVKKKTNHVTGIPEDLGGSGDPSPMTAYGVYMGIKASAKFKWGSSELKGKSIMIQGTGKVGESLIGYLQNDDVELYISDISEERVVSVANKYNIKKFNIGAGIYKYDTDIYCPCALGATLNSKSIDMLECSIVAGAANNQLEDEKTHGYQLFKKGILYAPDFLINSGGLINVYSEIADYDNNESRIRTEKIFDTTLKIFSQSEQNNISSHDAALLLAEKRILDKKKS